MLYNRNRRKKWKITLIFLYKLKNTESILQSSVILNTGNAKRGKKPHQQLLYSVMKEDFIVTENHVLSQSYSLYNASVHTGAFWRGGGGSCPWDVTETGSSHGDHFRKNMKAEGKQGHLEQVVQKSWYLQTTLLENFYSHSEIALAAL